MNDPCPIVLETLPSTPFTQRRTLPECSAIYFAISEEGTILYIGQTESLYHRWIQHNQMQQLLQFGFALIAWHVCPIEQLDELEAQCIEQFHPSLNRARGISSAIEKAEKTTISLYPTLWHTFRVACVQRETSASKEIQRLIAQQLAAWQRQAQKETDHA